MVFHTVVEPNSCFTMKIPLFIMDLSIQIDQTSTNAVHPHS